MYILFADAIQLSGDTPSQANDELYFKFYNDKIWEEIYTGSMIR